MLKGFKEFILRGNLLELAVAFVIGAAFAAVVKALVDDIVMPIVAAIAGKPDFANLQFTIHNSKFLYGAFINAVVAFVLVAFAVYFFIVVPMNRIMARRQRGEAPADPTSKQCPHCLSEVPVAATRCAFCTSDLRPTSGGAGPAPAA
jgi:large conductance mechanosensitive channel